MSTDMDPAQLFKKPPPEFGHPALQLFGFDPEYVNLNHGEFSLSYTEYSLTIISLRLVRFFTQPGLSRMQCAICPNRSKP